MNGNLTEGNVWEGLCQHPDENNIYNNCLAKQGRKNSKFPANTAICKCIECNDIEIRIQCQQGNAWEIQLGEKRCIDCPKKRCLQSYKPTEMRCESSETNDMVCTSLMNCLKVELGCDSHSGWQFLIHDPTQSNMMVFTNTTPNYGALLVGRETRKLDNNMLVQHHEDETFTLTCEPGFGLVNNNHLVVSAKGICDNGNLVVDPNLTCAPVCSVEPEDLKCSDNAVTTSGQSSQCFCKVNCRPIMATCGADLTWEYDGSLCQESRFEEIPFTTEVGFVAAVSNDEGTFRITCSKEYTELSPGSASCRNGNLEIGDLQCAANCAPPPEDLNCEQNIQSLGHGSEGDCYCLLFCNPVHIVCDNGQWKYEQSTCEKGIEPRTSLTNAKNGERAVVTYDFYDKNRNVNSFQVDCNQPSSTKIMGSAVCVNGSLMVELQPMCETHEQLETTEPEDDGETTTEFIRAVRKIPFCEEIPTNVQCPTQILNTGFKTNCHCKENLCQSIELTCTTTGHVEYNLKICAKKTGITDENGVLQKYFYAERYHFSCPKNYLLYGVHNATCKDGKPYFENKDQMPRCDRIVAENRTNNEDKQSGTFISGQGNTAPLITGIFISILLSFSFSVWQCFLHEEGVTARVSGE